MVPHNHKLKYPNPNICSCCLKTIYHHSENIIVVKKVPEVILDEQGEVVDKKGIAGPQGYFHARCMRIHVGMEGNLECEKCGVYVMAKNVQQVNPKTHDRMLTPIEDFCRCRCHQGQEKCSFVQIYHANEKAYGADKTYKKWEHKQKERLK